MTYPGSEVYYWDGAAWQLDSTVFKLTYNDSMINRTRLLTFYVGNPLDAVENANTYSRYQKIQVFDRISGIRIFLGRVERIEPGYSNDYGQYLTITCRDYIQEFFEQCIGANYSGVAQKRSAIISDIITNYSYGGPGSPDIAQTIEESGSTETIKKDFTSSDIKIVDAIESMAMEDKWDNTPTGYGYDYYVDDEPRFWYFKRGTKPTSDAFTGGMIISLFSSSYSPRVKHMLSDYIFSVNPIELVTRVAVFYKDTSDVTQSATAIDGILEASLGIVKEVKVSDFTIRGTDGERLILAQAKADAILAYYSGNVTRASIKIPDYPVYSMSPEVSGGAKLGHEIIPDIAISIWNFDEGSGTIAIDSHGINNLTLANGSFVNGQVNYAYSFDGATTTATKVGANGLPATTISIAGWLYITQLVDWNIIMEHDKNSDGGWNLNVDVAGSLNFTIKDGAGFVTASLAGIVINTWYRVGATYDGTNLYTYINGIQSAAAALVGKNLDAVGDIHVGYDGGAGNWFKGYIDELSLFPVALSSEQINFKTATHHAFRLAQRSCTGGSFWNFDEGYGTTAGDIYKFNNITLYGISPWSASGKQNTCMQLDGSTNYGQIANPTSFNFASDFSIIAWVKRSVAGIDHIVIAKSDSAVYGAAAKQFYISSANKLVFDVFGVGTVTSAGSIDTSWHQVVVTYTLATNTVQLYVDGVADSNGVLVIGADNAGHILTVGQRAITNYFYGLIDELGFYPSVLGVNQISSLYTMGRSFLPTAYDTLRGSFLGGTGWELLRAGHIVYVSHPLKGLYEDFLVLGISYIEPEGIAELELISRDRGRGTFAYAVTAVLASLKGKNSELLTRILQT